MRSRFFPVRAFRPRNPVVLALVRRMARATARPHRDKRRATRHEAEIDLAQRVRESGEW
jgi:hypothetical protein